VKKRGEKGDPDLMLTEGDFACLIKELLKYNLVHKFYSDGIIRVLSAVYLFFYFID
jgi:hypothetical protein